MNLEFVNETNFTPEPGQVIVASIFIFISCYLISRKVIRHSLIIPFILALVKSGVFAIYYLFFLKLNYFTIDSYNYMNTAIKAVQNIESVWSYTIDLLCFKLMHFFGLGHYIYNAFVTSLLLIFNSKSAIVPITANVILSILSAYVFTKTLIALGFKKKYAEWFFAFFILHWEMISWTTFPLLKDNLICFLSIGLFYFLVLIYTKKFKWYHLILACYSIGALMFMRFYLVPIFLMVFAVFSYLSILVEKKSAKTLGLILAFPLLFILILSTVWEQFGDYSKYLFDFNSNPIYGTIRFFLTPIPFQVSENLSYLTVPSLVNWILLPFTVAGILKCFGYRGLFKFLILYYFTIILFYGIYSPHGQATGPRHKVQVLFIYALFQFVGIMSLLFPKISLLLNQKSQK